MIDATQCPVLRGTRVRLDPLLAQHAEKMFALLDDDALWAYTGPAHLKSVEALYERYRLLETRRSPDGKQLWLNWAVVVDETDLTGFVQASVEKDSGEALIGYVIARRFWSLGLGTEAVGVMLKHLRDDLHVGTAIAYVDERNAASLRLLQKLAFRITNRADKKNQRLELTLRSGARSA